MTGHAFRLDGDDVDRELASIARAGDHVVEPAAATTDPDTAARDAQHYRFALVAVLEQALSIEELEAVAFGVQWPLERRAIDQDTAARAIVAYAERSIPALRKREAEAFTRPERIEAGRLAAMAAQIAARWRERCPSAFLERA